MSNTPTLRHVVTEALARMVALRLPNLPEGDAAAVWIAAMCDDLTGYDPGELREAFAAHRLSTDPAHRFMPTPGQIVALTPSHQGAAQAHARAGEWFAAALRQAGGVGTDALETMPPATAAAAVLARWRRAVPDIDPARAAAAARALSGLGSWRGLLHGDADTVQRVMGRRFADAFAAELRHDSRPALAPRALTVARG